MTESQNCIQLMSLLSASKILKQIQYMLLIAVSVVCVVTCMFVQFNVLTLALLFSKLKVKISGRNPLEPFKKQDLIYIT